MFFSEYAAIASQIELPLEALGQAIGPDNYEAWQEYLRKQDPAPAPSEIPKLFNTWACVYAPAVAAAGTAELSRLALLAGAKKALDNYTAGESRPADFRGGYADLLAMIERAPGAAISFDSRQADDNVADTWAGGLNTGCYGLWTGSSKESQITREFAASEVKIEARFRSVMVWVSTPGDWYNSSLLNLAYSDAGSPPWRADAWPDWQEAFGERGRMPRLIGSLVIVDGIDATIWSDGRYDEPDQKAIVENSVAGLWPFHCPSGAAGRNEVRFDAGVGMMIRTVTEPGNPAVLGANVLGIARYLGHSQG